MPAIINNQLGTIAITDEAIAVIAGLATIENAGIVGMAAKTAGDGFWELLKRENAKKGVHVTVVDNKVTVDLHVMVEYGVSICAVATNVRDNVMYHLEDCSGLDVTAVNVHVEGVRVQSV